MNSTELLVFNTAISEFGSDHQQMIACEECSELIKAITKYLRLQKSGEQDPEEWIERRDNIIEEITDVRIMIDQLIIIHKIGEDELRNARQSKVERLAERIGEKGIKDEI